MKVPVRVAVTGAAGQISYSLLFRLAAGEMLGTDQPIILQLLEITPALEALQGTVMEIEDCAFPLVAGIVQSDNPEVAFKDADYCVLVGARPRGPGMERKDLLEANAQIFSLQGNAINKVASRDVKVLVVGNPANTNALIAYRNAPDLDPSQFTAMTRLDHNRAIAQLANKTENHNTDINGMIIWGNHSATQYPDLHHCTVGGHAMPTELVGANLGCLMSFIPTVQQRGAAIIKAQRPIKCRFRRKCCDRAHARLGSSGTNGDIVSMGIYSDGMLWYRRRAGIYSFPVICAGMGVTRNCYRAFRYKRF